MLAKVYAAVAGEYGPRYQYDGRQWTTVSAACVAKPVALHGPASGLPFAAAVSEAEVCGQRKGVGGVRRDKAIETAGACVEHAYVLQRVAGA